MAAALKIFNRVTGMINLEVFTSASDELWKVYINKSMKVMGTNSGDY